MKANNGSGNNEGRDTWETPQGIFNVLDAQYNFNFDCCATEGNKKCKYFHDDFEKVGEIKDEICWMNPPFSKASRMFQHFFNVVEKGVAIYRCDNLETKIWQKLILLKADWIFIPLGRIHYEGMEGKSSRFPSALIGKGVKPPNRLKGITLEVKPNERV